MLSKTAILWVTYAAIAGFIVGASLFSPQIQPTQNQTTDTRDTTTKKKSVAQVTVPISADDRIATYTWYLAAFTFALVIVSAIQIHFLIRSDDTARISANAAQKSADAIAITERPYIFIWGLNATAPMISYGPPHGGFPQQVIQEKAYFIYSVSNRGKLAAVVENVSIACGYERNGQYPPLTIIGDHRLLQTPIVSSEQDVENIAYEIPWREIDRSNPSPEFRDDLIFRVVIAYRGPLTKGHETSECWHYIRSVNGFAEVADARYTYAR